MSSHHPCKKIVVLGSSGSIGENALRVVKAFPDRFQVIGLSVQSRVERLVQQARQFNVRRVAVADENAAQKCRDLASDLRVFSGPNAAAELIEDESADVVLVAVVGIAGLNPVMTALRHGMNVALATKEALVVGGRLVTDAAAETGAKLLPVDSEHSAIFQCLEGRSSENARRIILTASGGPFGLKSDVDFNKVTLSDALNHPTWSMGKKITIDSATMMNKGLELIEAHWFFDMPVDCVDVVIHPESIIHSIVEFVDGSMLAQLSVSDMRFAIQYALTYPDRVDGMLPRLDLASLGGLHFFKPDEKRFPCLRLAREAALAGGTMPAVLNAANEAAVRGFINNEIPFSAIGRIVESVMTKHDVIRNECLETLFNADRWANEEAARIMKQFR